MLFTIKVKVFLTLNIVYKGNKNKCSIKYKQCINYSKQKFYGTIWIALNVSYEYRIYNYFNIILDDNL